MLILNWHWKKRTREINISKMVRQQIISNLPNVVFELDKSLNKFRSD